MRRLSHFSVLLLAGASLAASPIEEGKKTWNFESDTPDAPAKGFAAEVGRWVVAQDSGNRVLAQQAKSGRPIYNVCLAETYRGKDVDLSVRLRSIAGEIDQGGGLVWRARDARNYYIARFNPLEDNFRVYKVQDGVRTQLGTADVDGDMAWHTLRITMAGSKMTCFLDGQKYLEAEDSTFPDAGRIGLWTKADAQTHFDDLVTGK